MPLFRTPEAPCPCGGAPAGSAYGRCCAPALANTQWPVTAEALMRSRFTAFVLRDADHLLRTWHPRTRPSSLEVDDNEWLGLTVLATAAGGEDDAEGTVDFVARFREPGDPARTVHEMREHSRFGRRAGRWMYIDGDVLPDGAGATR